MKSVFRGIAFIAAAVMLTSCTIIPKGIFSTGQVKLLSLSIPGTMQENVPYDAVVTFRRQGDAKITKACFRWIDENTLIKQQSLYCYSSEVADNAPIGSECWRWLAEGQYSYASPSFCAELKEVVYEEPGRFTVRLSGQNVKPLYNTLECYAEYLADGALKNSNRVNAKVVVHD